MRTISQRFNDSLGTSYKTATIATCTVPGGSTVALKLKPGATVNARRGTGAQRTVPNLTVTPVPGIDLFSLLSTPLAVFHIENGIDYGASDIETVPVFHGEAATGTMQIAGGDITLALVDMWARINRTPFADTFSAADGSRASQIATAILGAIPDATIHISGTGGTSTIDGAWSGSRSSYITTLATDGGLEVAADGNGEWFIRPLPIITPAVSAWTLRTGENGNIIDASRTKPLNKIYNTVTVSPMNDDQVWDMQTIALSDVTDPRDPSIIGPCVFAYQSPTIETADEASAIGRSILQQLLKGTESATVSAMSNPALEPGDTITIAHATTDTDPGFGATQILDQFTLNLDAGSMTTTSTNAALYQLENL